MIKARLLPQQETHRFEQSPPSLKDPNSRDKMYVKIAPKQYVLDWTEYKTAERHGV